MGLWEAVRQCRRGTGPLQSSETPLSVNIGIRGEGRSARGIVNMEMALVPAFSVSVEPSLWDWSDETTPSGKVEVLWS